MNEIKIQNRIKAKNAFIHNGISYKSFNNDLQWKIGNINFFPTTHKWNDELNDERGQGLSEFIKYLLNKEMESNNYLKMINKSSPIKLSIEDMFNIAKKVKPMNLEKVCEAIHKAVYQ